MKKNCGDTPSATLNNFLHYAKEIFIRASRISKIQSKNIADRAQISK